MAIQPPLVRMRDLVKRYGDGPVVLDRVALEVRDGDFVALIGPSGCGKSTLLKLIAGLSPVTSGELWVDGMLPENAREELSFVFQDPTLLPWLTVASNVEVPLRIRGMDARKREAMRQRMLELVGLSHVTRHFPRQLSGGMRMRVSIARALALTPRILLLDEPFGALDEMTRDRLNEELLELRRHQAWTAFFVTHSVAEAVFLSNRIVVLAANPGRVHAEIAVPFAYPRTVETRASAEYQALVVEVSRMLRSVEGSAAHGRT